jgi:hypothetical protein
LTLGLSGGFDRSMQRSISRLDWAKMPGFLVHGEHQPDPNGCT